jgi:hypothetical protein
MIDLRLAIVAGLHYGLPHGGNKNLALKLFTSDKYGKYGNIYIYIILHRATRGPDILGFVLPFPYIIIHTNEAFSFL